MSRVAPPPRKARICGAHAYGETLSLGESRSIKPRHVRPRASRSNPRSRSVPKPRSYLAFNSSPSLSIHLMQRVSSLFSPWASSITCGMTPSPVLARRTASASSESTTPSLSDLPPPRVRMHALPKSI